MTAIMSMMLLLVLLVFVGFVTSLPYPNSRDVPTTYKHSRKQLIAKDDEYRMNINLNNDEIKADAILSMIKKREIERLKSVYPPEHNFIDYRTDIASSSVYKLLRTMPKGAVLHVHSNSIVGVDWIIKNLTYRDDLYMSIDQSPTASQPYGMMRFFYDAPSSSSSLKSPSWTPLSHLRLTSDNITAFDIELKRNLSLIGDHKGNGSHVWDMFSYRDSLINGIILCNTTFGDYIYESFRQFYADGVMHIDIRHVIHGYKPDGTQSTPDEQMEIFLNALTRFRRNVDKAFTISIIICGERIWSVKDVEINIELALRLHYKFPQLVTGYDLVGQEDAGHPLIFFADLLSQKQYQLPSFSYFFHAGETDWSSVGSNLYDAILLNTTRIGHGFALFKHPELLRLVKERGIAVEVCPISNQVLGLVHDLRVHPASFYINNDIPITINPDDPGIWNAAGVSFDFFEAFMAWDITLGTLKKLVLNSIKYCSLPAKEADDTRAALYNDFEKKWKYFVANMLQGTWQH